MWRIGKWIGASAAIMVLSGCGTYVPEIQENRALPSGGQLLIIAIVGKVRCELKNAVIDTLGAEGQPQNLSQQQGNYMKNWGALLALTLNVEEKGTASPNAVLSPPGIFSMGIGVTGSSDATRKETFNFFYTVEQLRTGPKCLEPYNGQPNAPHDSFLLDSDLKIGEWLRDQVILVGSDVIGAPAKSKSILKQSVFSHEVKFEVVTSGSINPSWKLTRATVDQSGNLLTASRDRTHDLTITFGPLDPSQNNLGLVPLAESIHTSGIYGNAFGSAIRSATPGL